MFAYLCFCPFNFRLLIFIFVRIVASDHHYQTVPDIFYTRKVERRRGEYYGPFTNVYSARFLIKLIKDIYPFLNHELNHMIKKETEDTIKIKFF